RDQWRELNVRSRDVFAVADSDEWDDKTHTGSAHGSGPSGRTPEPGASGRRHHSDASPDPSPSKSRRRSPAPTYLSMKLSTRGGQLLLKPGGPAQEFTLTLRNGNTHSYRNLAPVFQMEGMPDGGPGPGYVLERWDPADKAWQSVRLRIANDVLPYESVKGGTPLKREAVSARRYRLRALAGAPAGPNPLMLDLVDTDTHTTPTAHTSLPQTTLGG
ncbi:hypothetical protein AB0O40_36300, partial [Streptomyces sp. NPDC089919]